MNIEEIINDINHRKDEYIIIGVSAGPDSMALLNMLLTSSNKKIICAHINHNIRKESDIEEKYLKEFCNKMNIIFESTKITKYKENNFENEARKNRYAFFERILKKYDSHTLLLAHHGTDLIETVIMKILRGTNMEGYAGIKLYSNVKNYTIIRPLLYTTKEELIKYNKMNKIKYFLDNSNNDISFLRNRIRKNIIPLLKKEDPFIHLKFLKYSNTIQEYYNYVERTTAKIIADNYQKNKININVFKKEDPFIQKNILFYMLSNIYDNKDNIIKEKHIINIIDLINNDKPNSSINLPQNIIAKKEYNTIYIEKKQKESKDYKILLKETTKINNFTIKKIENTDIDNNNICRLNSKHIKLPLYIRNRKNGDYIETLGLNGKKKIKDIFIEEKIPIDNRNKYPLLVDSDDKILWIPNIKKSKYNVKKNELYDIILTSYKEREEANEKEKH